MKSAKAAAPPPLTQRERKQTCLGCGATIRLPRSSDLPLCVRCRAKGSARKGSAAPALFEKVISPAQGSRIKVRPTTLLFALAFIIAAFVTLRERGATSPGQKPAAPTAPSSPAGGVEVMFDAPTPASSK